MDTSLLVNIGVVVVFIIFIGYLFYTKRITRAKKIILAIVVQAENIFGTGTGSMKYAYVLGILYPKLPSIIRLFVSEQTLNDWIEEAVATLKSDLQVTIATESISTVESSTEVASAVVEETKAVEQPIETTNTTV